MEGELESSDNTPLIQREERGMEDEVRETFISKAEVLDEAKRQICLAGPLIAVTILQYLVQVISVMFVGHLGELPLSSASLATSFASVTGFYVLLGLSSALETLCGGSYGAQKYSMLGLYTQRAMIILLVSSIPLSLIWYYTTDILIFCRQDHEIAKGAGIFNQWMIPSLFGYGLLQCLTRFFQTQNIVLPMMMTSGVTAILHVLVCWVLIFKFELGIIGAALANNIAYWINFFLLAFYVKFSPAWMKTWTGFSREAFHDLWNFLKLAVPSAFMICLEYWSFEMVVLLAGLLAKPKLETSVLSISLNTCWMVYMVSVGLGSALSTRVSNELGAGRPRAARLALFVMVIMSIVEGLVVATATILVRFLWGRLYSNDEEVVRYVAKMMFLLALSDFLDGFQCVLSGAARGCGWQNMCSIINLGAYYFVALPCAVLFAFVLHMGGAGLWMGIICGLLVQVIVLVTVNLFTDWDKEGSRALARV
ncbi:protein DETOXIFICATION 16 isoform X2 [Beta vulgaris subsp. vulgaris]|uniref:protein DETOXIFICATION 16 isoform X2 n=1 Tax=Beta vulgaris subsp. vulgaris TaxID=3555 RepID=UPI00203739C6|nr:protein DETOXIFICATION 16 isoform X2 [Beta vulgaris subsp. vulgaris]